MSWSSVLNLQYRTKLQWSDFFFTEAYLYLRTPDDAVDREESSSLDFLEQRLSDAEDHRVRIEDSLDFCGVRQSLHVEELVAGDGREQLAVVVCMR